MLETTKRKLKLVIRRKSNASETDLEKVVRFETPTIEVTSPPLEYDTNIPTITTSSIFAQRRRMPYNNSNILNGIAEIYVHQIDEEEIDEVEIRKSQELLTRKIGVI